jgi:acetyl-CoA C-acetyltransferase
MSVDPRTPCIIGVAQQVWRPGAGEAPEPLVMWEHVARAAARDAASSIVGGPDAVLAAMESVQVVYCQSWQYDDPPSRLSAAIGADPAHRLYSGIGGTTPQQLVASTGESILRGELDLALIAGAEALDTKRRMKKDGRRPDWSYRDETKRPFPFEAPFIDAEIAHEVFQAWLTFPLFDIGRRAHLGLGVDEHRAQLGELFAPMTKIAAANPYAWFPVERSASELATATPENRLVGFPYTKYLVSVMDVDLAGALIVASHARADALGVPPDRRVYLRGWCYATDPTYVAEHASFHESPAMRATSTEALARAGITIDDVAHLDLYSCFPSSVLYALDALGVAPDDGRGLTVTGGLPYAGGAGSDYMTHSLATMVDVLRDDAGTFGLVSGVGMHMTKHAYGVYSSDPPPAVAPVVPGDAVAVQRQLDQIRMKGIRDAATGAATIATYSVVHGRDGSPQWGLAICDLPQGDRCYAKVFDPELLADLEVEEWVGRAVHLVPGDTTGIDGVGANVNVLKA